MRIKKIAKKCMAALLLLTMAVGTDSVAAQADQKVSDVFEDVNAGDWYEDYVQYAYNNEIMTGLNNKQFGPNDLLVRAQFAVIVWRMEKSPAMAFKEVFPDVEDEVWYTDAIIWAAEKKIVNGYTDTGYFGPADQINREQMAVMMYRYADYLGYDTETKADFSKFTDADQVDEFADEAIQWAVANKIISGKYEGKVLDPRGNATRAECAAIIQRFIENVVSAAPDDPDPIAPDDPDPIDPDDPNPVDPDDPDPVDPAMTSTEYMQAVRKLVTEKEPNGITDEKAGVDYGDLRKYTYYSTTAQRNTNVNVLLPAGYSEEEEYPVLYVLHGYWGTEDALLDAGDASLRLKQMIGNLTAQGEAEKMIVVFPYIYCSKDQQYCSGLDLQNSLNYDNFINDLTTDLMPYIEENFAVATGRENTAITGFSMGGRESLFIGLTRSDLFGYVGAACPAPGLTPGDDPNFHPGQLKEDKLLFDKEKGEPSLIMVSAAVNDGVVGNAPQNYHTILTENGVDHVWHTVADGDHGGMTIRPHIYNFVRSIFKKSFDVSTEPDENEWDDYKETDSAEMQEFYQNAIYNMGNTYRLRSKIEKAQKGEEVKIAYLGGSITEGVGKDNTCYAKRSYDYFADTFGTGDNVKYINKGLSGTSSVVGLIRAQYDILNDDPDVVFIEFSVNDNASELCKKSFEGLVRQCLSWKSEPAVIIVVNRSKGGNTMQEQMGAIGKNYDVPVLSMDIALTKAFASGLLTTDDYFEDEFHPHDAGNKLISDAIAYYYRQALKTVNRDESYRMPVTSVYGTEYATATLAPPWELADVVNGSFASSDSNYRFPYGWKFVKGSANTPMTFKATGKGIFILFQSKDDETFGNLKVTVNGQTSVISGKRPYTWGGPDADIAYIQNESGTLDVSICMEDVDKEFSIWGIGVIK